eukprot:2224903-Prymnesium_polylepis.1
MMQTCTHTAARGHVPACPDGAPCLPARLGTAVNRKGRALAAEERTARDKVTSKKAVTGE